MIKSLTPEQESKFHEYVKKFTEIGLSTEQISQEETEVIIHQVYKCGKVAPPKKIIHVGSPLAIFYAYALLDEQNNKGFSLSNVVSNVESNVMSNVRINVMSNVRSNVMSNVRINVMSNVESVVESNVMSNVVSNVESNVRINVRSNVRNGLLWGHHQAGWLSFYAYFQEVCGIKLPELSGLLRSLELGWFYAGSDVCIVSSKPCELHLNNSGQLHCETGMAISYPDGYGLFFINGVSKSKIQIESNLVWNEL